MTRDSALTGAGVLLLSLLGFFGNHLWAQTTRNDERLDKVEQYIAGQEAVNDKLGRILEGLVKPSPTPQGDAGDPVGN